MRISIITLLLMSFIYLYVGCVKDNEISGIRADLSSLKEAFNKTVENTISASTIEELTNSVQQINQLSDSLVKLEKNIGTINNDGAEWVVLGMGITIITFAILSGVVIKRMYTRAEKNRELLFLVTLSVLNAPAKARSSIKKNIEKQAKTGKWSTPSIKEELARFTNSHGTFAK